MVEAIYNKIANKELSTWCVIQINEVRGMCDKDSFSLVYNKDISRYANEYITIDYSDLLEKLDNYEDIEFEWNKIKSAENKWHPVMIGDVFDYMFRCEDWTRNEWIIDEVTEKLIMPQSKHQWWNKRKPIEEQSEECKEYVYNLLTNA